MEPNIEETRQLHKRIGQLFGNTTGKSSSPKNPKSPYQNLPDLLTNGPPISSINENAEFYLPPIIDFSKIPKNRNEIKKVELTTEICENQPIFTYQISWFEKKEMPKKSINKSSFLQNSTKSGSNSEESDVDEPVPLVKKTSSMMKIPGKVRCDGPCSQIVDSTLTIQFGCDHVICENCRKKCQSAALFDGSPGCCNVNCVQQAKAEGNKVCVGQSDSVTSIASKVGTIESIVTHICILKNYGRDVLRTQLELEFPSTARLSVIVKSLAHYKDLIANSRFYYSTHKPTVRSDVHPISLTDTNLRFYDIVDLKTPPILYLIVVGSAIKLIDSR